MARQPGIKKNKPKVKVDMFRLICLLTLVLIVLNIMLAALIIDRRNSFGKKKTESNDTVVYDQHYAMIVSSGNKEFWEAVYSGAQTGGNANGAYVERLGSNLAEAYDSVELMRIAIAEHVDGIMLEYNGEEELDSLIELAREEEIPVVTLLRDSTSSPRISHVGVSYYNLGQQYAEQISYLVNRRAYEKKVYRVYLLMNADISDTSRNIVYSTIQDSLASDETLKGSVSLTPRLVDESGSFEVEETIREIFLDEEEMPDIIVCLDELTGESVYQALIDYNQVGKVEEIAYYSGTTILKGIEKQIIHSTATVDAASIGQDAVEALLEYHQTGYASDYYSVDTYIVDINNIMEYMGGDGDEE